MPDSIERLRQNFWPKYALTLLTFLTICGTAQATSILPPCTRFQYVESYNIDEETLPKGIKIVRVKADSTGSSDLDYIDYHLHNPILLEEPKAFLKIENSKVSKHNKARFKGLEGIPGDPVHEPWNKRPNPSFELLLSRLVRLEKTIDHPFPIGSDEKQENLPGHPFSINGIADPKWENAKILGTPFQITGKVFYQRNERKCPSTEE